jgi:hypothetical protein
MRAARFSLFAMIVATLSLVACKDEAAAVAKAEPAKAAEATKAEPAKAAASQPAAHADEHGDEHKQKPGTKTALGKGETPSERSQIDEDGVVRRGTALPKEVALVSVADCVAKADELAGKEVKVAGRVAKVCAKKGCWWSVENPQDPNQRIRVTHKDYGFFVPADAKGKDAIAYGTLEVKKMSEAEAVHMAQDEGQTAIDPKTLPKVELRLLASAIEMKKPQS